MIDDGDQLLTIDDVAALFRVPANTLRHWRKLGEGPPAVKLGRAVRFRQRDVTRWIDAHREAPPEPLATVTTARRRGRA